MNKNSTLIFTQFLFILFSFGTLISLFIVYRNIDNGFAYKFLVGYLFLSFFMLLYVPVITIINSRKLKWVEIRKRLYKFVTLFVLFGAFNYGFDCIFRPSKIDVYRAFSAALGIAFTISFIDITFFSIKKSSD